MHLTFPSYSFGDYIIHLKNGNKIIANKYTKKSNELTIYQSSGSIGLPYNIIVNIEKVDDDEMLPKKKINIIESSQQKDSKKILVDSNSTNVNLQYKYLQQKLYLLNKRNKIKNNIIKSKSTDDIENQEDLRRKLLSIQDNISELRKQIKKNNQDEIPDWWNNSP